jgi:hypothetical protein
MVCSFQRCDAGPDRESTSPVRHVCITHSGVDDDGARALAAALHMHPLLESLDLSANAVRLHTTRVHPWTNLVFCIRSVRPGASRSHNLHVIQPVALLHAHVNLVKIFKANKLEYNM